VLVLLKKLKLKRELFQLIHVNNIPFPVGFLVWRLANRIRTNSMVFGISGESTAINIVESIQFKPHQQPESHAVSFEARMSQVTVVRDRRNLAFSPHFLPVRCEGGVGVTMMAPTFENARLNKKQGPVKADLVVTMVPYGFEYKSTMLDFSGAPHRALCNRMNQEEDYPTASYYKEYWAVPGDEERTHIWHKSFFNNPNARHATLALMDSHKRYDITGRVETHVDGVGPFGRCVSAATWSSLGGTSTYTGRGVGRSGDHS